MASFILRGVDSALWTAARQACKAEQVQLVALIENYLTEWLSVQDGPELTQRHKNMMLSHLADSLFDDDMKSRIK